jgi:hypothetical protein
MQVALPLHLGQQVVLIKKDHPHNKARQRKQVFVAEDRRNKAKDVHGDVRDVAVNVEKSGEIG